MEIELRNERFSDYPETENVVREAFWNRYSPGCYEHYLIHIMRYSRAFVPQLDFVAVFDDKIVGNIVFLKSVIQADTGGFWHRCTRLCSCGHTIGNRYILSCR